MVLLLTDGGLIQQSLLCIATRINTVHAVLYLQPGVVSSYRCQEAWHRHGNNSGAEVTMVGGHAPRLIFMEEIGVCHPISTISLS